MIPVTALTSMVAVAPVKYAYHAAEMLRGEALVVERIGHVSGRGEGEDGRLHSSLH